ncbi:MAG: type IV pili methyl-accepting chemotaxis transducer N-terminal domain-containing protein [Saprospiraceae bacterium]|nr:type IV pili methyl-accepting chemotaxis transducer N-terminal domain-containing protein [Saprospiraceae bacterium]
MDNQNKIQETNGKARAPHEAITMLRKYYFLALSIILLTILSSQVFIFNHLKEQNSDSRVINIAGRQRMLSQKLVKEVLYLKSSIAPDDSTKWRISKNLETWTTSHTALKNRNGSMGLSGSNSADISAKFADIQPVFEALRNSILNVVNGKDVDDREMYQLSETFLDKMDSIVFTYDAEANQRVNALQKLEISFLIISIIVLVLEILLIFRPASNYASDIINKLTTAENEALSLAAQNSKLFKDLELSTEELRAMNYALDHTTMFASLDNAGKIKYISEKFRNLLNIKGDVVGKNIVEFLANGQSDVDRFMSVFKNMKSSVWYDEIEVSQAGQQKTYLDVRLVPVYRFGMRFELFLICSDITKRVLATQELNKLNREKYEDELKEQKSRSSQILNAQEEERKRIARDMHDGIGQMLTALKFNVEGITVSNGDPNGEKLKEINALAKNIIQEVRTTTFNLTPPELTDYGIVAAIKKMSVKLQNITGHQVMVSADGVQDLRFDPALEINLYRIVQEAVNNALKYSHASIILIKISRSEDMLSIAIIDDGSGFDLNMANKHVAGSGKGITNMKERASMINARLFISSEIGTGTKITINLPLSNLS